MINARSAVAKLALAAMLAGSLAVVPGMAGADEGSGEHHPSHHTRTERHQLCTNEQARLAARVRRQQQFAANTVGFIGLEATAAKAHDTQLEAYWAKVVVRRQGYSARRLAEYQARVARDTRAHLFVNGKCS